MADESTKEGPFEGVDDIVDVSRGRDEELFAVWAEGERGDEGDAWRHRERAEGDIVADLELVERALEEARVGGDLVGRRLGRQERVSEGSGVRLRFETS